MVSDGRVRGGEDGSLRREFDPLGAVLRRPAEGVRIGGGDGRAGGRGSFRRGERPLEGQRRRQLTAVRRDGTVVRRQVQLRIHCRCHSRAAALHRLSESGHLLPPLPLPHRRRCQMPTRKHALVAMAARTLPSRVLDADALTAHPHRPHPLLPAHRLHHKRHQPLPALALPLPARAPPAPVQPDAVIACLARLAAVGAGRLLLPALDFARLAGPAARA